MRTRVLVLASLALLIISQRSFGADIQRRWVYLQLNMQVPENVEKASALMRRAAAAGYNGIVLADYKLNILDRVPDHYFRHMASIQKLAGELKLELIPTVAPFGYSDGLLAHNPNLVEGLPVKNAPMMARQGEVILESELKDALPGGDFEKHRDHQVTGWNFQDAPSKASFVDTSTKHTGNSSLRWEQLQTAAGESGNGRVSRTVKLSPYRQYHLTVWIRTEDFDAASSVRLFAMGSDGRVLSFSDLGVDRTQDWRKHHVIVNSLEYSEIRVYCGTWGGRGGRLWMDDLRMEEVAFVNLVRRNSCPLVVTGMDGKPFEEGRDFAKLEDPQLGTVPYAGSFDVYHEPPRMKLLPGSRIREGDRLRVNYFHSVTIHENQVCCCLADSEVFRVLDDQIGRVEKLLHPQTYFLSHDEIRVANWCDACQRSGRSAGQLLAENVRQSVATIRKHNPNAKLCVWSDMFDPHHNARDKFYLVNGDLSGAWEGLPTDMTVVNWNHGQAAKSLPFFAKLGHHQTLAGYYDGSPSSIRNWLQTGSGVSGVDGVMYTTWQGKFSDLEEFAKFAWGK